jgi:hypothetical protein
MRPLDYARPVSFLADPILLALSGEAYARAAPEEAQGGRAKAAAAACVAVYWAISGASYLNSPWAKPLVRPLPGHDGRDWMVNSGLFRLDSRRRTPRMDLAALLIFATYPLWLWLGWDHGRRRRPRGPVRSSPT